MKKDDDEDYRDIYNECFEEIKELVRTISLENSTFLLADDPIKGREYHVLNPFTKPHSH